jgi:hypothetical protein
MTLQQTITPDIVPDNWWMGILGGNLYMVVADNGIERAIVYKSTNGTTWTEFLDVPEFFIDVSLLSSSVIPRNDLALFDTNFLTVPVLASYCAIFNAAGEIRRVVFPGDNHIIANGSKSLLQTDSQESIGNMVLIGDPASTIRVPDLLVTVPASGDLKIPYIVTGD